LLLLAVGFAGCRHEPDRAAGKWQIVFVSDRDGEWATHAVNPDGSGRIRVAPSDGPGFGPAVVSPDGRYAVVGGSRQLRVVRAGERGWKRIASGDPSSVAWSPDGKRIVFVGLSRGLSIIDADGENGRRLTRRLGDSEPAWSPDGKRIAFVRPGVGVLVVDPEGRRAKVVWPEEHAASLRWADDGRALSLAAPLRGAVVTVSVATGAIVRGIRGVHADWWIAWSPDGRRFAYSSRPGLYVMSSDGSRRRRLAANGTEPAWAPDGRSIAYVVSTQQTGPQLWSIRPDATGRRRLTAAFPNGGIALQPAWIRGPVVETPSPYRFAVRSKSDGAELRLPYSVTTLGGAGSLVVLAPPPRVWTTVWVQSPPLVLWEAASGRVTRVARPGCSDVAASVVVLRAAIAFDCAGGHAAHYGRSVQFFERARPFPVSLAYGLASEGCKPSELPGTIAGAGSLLVFSRTPVRCWERRRLPRSLWRADGKQKTLLISGPDASEPTAVGGNRIAVERDDGVVTVLRADGMVIGRVDLGVGLPRRSVLESRRPTVGLTERRLVVLRGGRLRIFEIPALRPMRSWRVPSGATFAGIARGLVAYVAGANVHVRRLSDGRVTVLRTSGRDVEARITAAGLFYAVHRRRVEDYERPPFDANPAEVFFLRHDALSRRFRTSR
jgi:TolB protein